MSSSNFELQSSLDTKIFQWWRESENMNEITALGKISGMKSTIRITPFALVHTNVEEFEVWKFIFLKSY